MTRMHTLPISGALLLALLLLTTIVAPTPTSAEAAQPASRPVARVGLLSQATGSGFALETRAGTLAVTFSANTWILVEKDGQAVEGAATDLLAGKATFVAGMLSSDGKALAARAVAQGPAAQRLASRLANVARRPAGRAMHHMGSGTITAVDGSTLTLRGHRTPQITVAVRADTIVLRGQYSDLGTLKVGEHIQVLGIPIRSAERNAGSRTLEAWVIRVDSGSSGFAHGRVTSVNGNNLVLVNVRGRDRLSITLDGSTQYKQLTIQNGEPVVKAATQTDVRTGGHLAVEGAISPDGRTMTARAVIVLGAPVEAGQ
jgi:hypothetical protein